MKREATGQENKNRMLATAPHGMAIRFFQQSSSRFGWKNMYSKKLPETIESSCCLNKKVVVTSAQLNDHFQGSRKFNETN
jgi:hypothetical protein